MTSARRTTDSTNSRHRRRRRGEQVARGEVQVEGREGSPAVFTIAGSSSNLLIGAGSRSRSRSPTRCSTDHRHEPDRHHHGKSDRMLRDGQLRDASCGRALLGPGQRPGARGSRCKPAANPFRNLASDQSSCKNQTFTLSFHGSANGPSDGTRPAGSRSSAAAAGGSRSASRSRDRARRRDHGLCVLDDDGVGGCERERRHARLDDDSHARGDRHIGGAGLGILVPPDLDTVEYYFSATTHRPGAAGRRRLRRVSDVTDTVPASSTPSPTRTRSWRSAVLDVQERGRRRVREGVAGDVFSSTAPSGARVVERRTRWRRRRRLGQPGDVHGGSERVVGVLDRGIDAELHGDRYLHGEREPGWNAS